MAVTDLRLMPYMLELEQACDLALGRFRGLEREASAWIAARTRPCSTSAEHTAAMGEMVGHQTTFFELLEAFLAMWARASLLLFPSVPPKARGGYADRRGQALRTALNVAENHGLADRDLRDSWMHFDERLDLVVQSGADARQRFVVSGEVTPEAKKRTPRLVEMDTLRVHFHDRDGSPRQAGLKDLQANLWDILERVKAGWGALRDFADLAVDSEERS